MEIKQLTVNGSVTLVTGESTPQAIKIKADPGEVESVTFPLVDGTMAQFDITDRGEGRIRFDSRDCLGESCLNKGGNLDGDIENADIQKYVDDVIGRNLPSWLWEMIISTGRQTKDYEIYETDLFIPDASEIFGEADWYETRYCRLDYYRNPHNRVKANKPCSEDACWYWSASAHSGDSTGAVFVGAGGVGNGYVASGVYGVPVCFRIMAADLGGLIGEAVNHGGTVRRAQVSK